MGRDYYYFTYIRWMDNDELKRCDYIYDGSNLSLTVLLFSVRLTGDNGVTPVNLEVVVVSSLRGWFCIVTRKRSPKRR